MIRRPFGRWQILRRSVAACLEFRTTLIGGQFNPWQIIDYGKRNGLPVMFHTSDVLRITTFWNHVLYI
jgi:hypothetical protein